MNSLKPFFFESLRLLSLKIFTKNRQHVLLSVILSCAIIISSSMLHAHDSGYVHPYIAEQAFWVWPKDTSHEVYTYLGYGLKTPCEDFSCESTMCNDSKSGASIIEGAIEEEWYDTVAKKCNTSSSTPFGFSHHFYDPDIPTDDTNGLCDSQGAAARAQTYWNNAISAYKNGVKNTAYWYLGKIAHLLADLSVPAHVHRDPHTSSISDSYEKYH